MNAIGKRLEAVREARAKAVQASEAWSGYLSMSDAKTPPDPATDALAAFLRVAEAAERELAAKEAERRALFERTPVLQARIVWNGNERRIVVAKPNAQVADPYIPEVFYSAIRANWKMAASDTIVTSEPYEIAVVDRSMRVVAVIGNML